MLEEISHAAAADAGASPAALADLDVVALVSIAGWRVQNGPRVLAERLGASPRQEYVATTGGESPLPLVNRVAREIAAGRARSGLIAGCNNLKTLGRARRAGVQLDWKGGGSGEPTVLGKERAGSSEREVAYGMRMPIDVYPMFENALRARRGLDLKTHRQRMGALFSPFSEVAARNPYAWFPVARSPEELTEVTPSNRMVGFPYTKYLNAVLDTDQAAGVWLTSVEYARALGIPEERWVYWRGGAQDEEVAWYASERPDFARCPALRRTALTALEEGGLGFDDLDLLDFYSCFPVAVSMACEMLGLAEDDPRGFTQCGGLPYAGGPANNYTLHSLACTLDRVRERSGAARGLVSGNGWYLTKHSAVVVSKDRPETAARAEALPTPTPGPDEAPVSTLDQAYGPATIETYTVLYGRDAAPERGIVICRLDDGGRCLANSPEDREQLEALTLAESVGRRGRVKHIEGLNRFELD
jgi:acetyl-CoA C-acetyltransferase